MEDVMSSKIARKFPEIITMNNIGLAVNQEGRGAGHNPRGHDKLIRTN